MMKKTIPRSEWEAKPGFNRTEGKYIRLDCDDWLAAHRIRAEGKRRGELNQPDSSETLPDVMFLKIESWIQKRALDCREEVGKYIEDRLADLHHIRSSWEKENPEIALDALVTQRCQNLDAQVIESVNDLDRQRAAYDKAARDLKGFCQRYRLSRVAHYPSSQAAHWLWVPVAMIIESFVGANLLGSVSRGGVIEGWMVAVVLTFVNVLVGIWAGRMWRFTHYDWGFVKLFAYAQGALCAAVAVVWNNVAGHVRDVYVLAEKTGALEAPDEAFATAWRTMIESPLPWESLPSAGLALVGIAVFVLTTYKAYTADDPFPGYGARHRKVEELHGSYQNDLNDALGRLESIRDEANAAIEEVKNRYQMDRAVWENTLDKLRMVVDEYPVNLRLYNKDMAYLLASYRSANLEARTAQPPPFFDTEPTIDEDVVQAPEFSVPDPPSGATFRRRRRQGSLGWRRPTLNSRRTTKCSTALSMTTRRTSRETACPPQTRRQGALEIDHAPARGGRAPSHRCSRVLRTRYPGPGNRRPSLPQGHRSRRGHRATPRYERSADSEAPGRTRTPRRPDRLRERGSNGHFSGRASRSL